MHDFTSKKKLPRHDAGSFELKEGTGPITGMCNCKTFLEIYKIDKTFRVQTPESIDPEETNPNAPWVASPVADVGSANLIVARVLLQAKEMLDSAVLDKKIDKEAITLHMHAIKETLLACEKLCGRLVGAIDSVINKIETAGVQRDNHGRGLNPFPQVPDLDADTGSFLIQVNRCIKLFCELPHHFFDLDRIDSNFDHLLKRLTAVLGEAEPCAVFIQSHAENVRYLVNLRNFHEHPKATRTVIHNFRVLPSGVIAQPEWQLQGEIQSQAVPIKLEAVAIVDYLRDLIEELFIHVLMPRVSKTFPFYLARVPDEKVDANLPIRYRLSVDIARLQIQSKTSSA